MLTCSLQVFCEQVKGGGGDVRLLQDIFLSFEKTKILNLVLFAYSTSESDKDPHETKAKAVEKNTRAS